MKSKLSISNISAVYIGKSPWINFGQTGRATLIGKVWEFFVDGNVRFGEVIPFNDIYVGPPDVQARLGLR
jgi:hypothetical protein